jgi:hypothetical protein
MECAHSIVGSPRTRSWAHHPQGHLATEIIRIRPIVSFNVDPDQAGFATRDVTPSNVGKGVA